MEKFKFKQFWDLVKNDRTVLDAWNQVTDQLLNLPADQQDVRQLMEKPSQHYEFVKLTMDLWCSRQGTTANYETLTKCFRELDLISIAEKLELLDISSKFENPEELMLDNRITTRPDHETEKHSDEFETKNVDKVLLGIDLGTTYSCAGIWRNGKVEILQTSQISSILPSCVTFQDRKIIVGDKAKLTKNPANTISEIKRLIGRSYNDPEIQNDFGRWAFKIVNSDGFPFVRVRVNAECKDFSPEEISSFILLKIKRLAEDHVGHEVKRAVVTVPANFNNSQREATKNAAKIAGLDVIQIVNEPTAAALAYGLNKKEDPDGSEIEGRNILVYDLGGGTFDVTILSVDINTIIQEMDNPASYFDVLATGGDTHLGGEDFDTRLANRFRDDFEKEHNVDLSNEHKVMVRIRTTAEKAKCVLSSKQEATVSIESLYNGLDFNTTITRQEFEDLCEDLFAATIGHVENVLSYIELDKSKIQEVVMIGGSTRIPRIYELLSQFFDSDTVVINNSINPDEAVACGATVLAATLVPSSFPLLDVCLTDVIPASLGIAVKGFEMSTVIKRFSPIPGFHSKLFTTFFENQTKVEISIYEGESSLVDENNKLGSFLLNGIREAPRGVPQIDVAMNIDGCGILHVSATEQRSGISKSISIKRVDAELSEQSMETMKNNVGVLFNAGEISVRDQINESTVQ